MTITTQDRLVAAQANSRKYKFTRLGGTGLSQGAGYFYDYWTAGGRPGAAAVPSPGINGEQVDYTKGGINPVNAGGTNQLYLNAWSLASDIPTVATLYDRLWQNSGLSVTTSTAQSITPVAMPSRDENGASGGANIEAFLQIYTSLGNAGNVAGATINYTNQDGVSGRTGTIPTIPTGAKAGLMLPIALAAGDSGVRSIQGITLGASLTSGAIGLVLARSLAEIGISVANGSDFRNFFDLGQKLWANGTLSIMSLCATGDAPSLRGSVSFCEG